MSIARFIHADAGHISHGERVLLDTGARRTVAAERRELGIVFQSYALWPHMSVADNGRQAIATRVAEMLDLVELGQRSAASPHELSGGQQQRVALARALAHGHTALLLDEPFSNLDANCASAPGTGSRNCNERSASPPCSSPTTRPRPWRSASDEPGHDRRRRHPRIGLPQARQPDSLRRRCA